MTDAVGVLRERPVGHRTRVHVRGDDLAGPGDRRRIGGLDRGRADGAAEDERAGHEREQAEKPRAAAVRQCRPLDVCSDRARGLPAPVGHAPDAGACPPVTSRSSSDSPRRAGRTSAARGSARTATDMNVEVGFISGFGISGSWPSLRAAPQRGDWSWRRQLGSTTGRGSTAPLPSGRWSWRLIGRTRGRPRRARLGQAPRRRRRSPSPSADSGSARESSVRATPSSQSSISWVNETSLLNSAPTDSPRWIRLIASPIERRDRDRRDLADPLRRRQRHGVGQDDLAQRRLPDPLDRRVAQDAVRGAGVDLGDALALEGPDDLDQRARGVDLVVDDDRPPAADVADDVHQLGPVEVADPPLLDDRERRVERPRRRPGPASRSPRSVTTTGSSRCLWRK